MGKPPLSYPTPSHPNQRRDLNDRVGDVVYFFYCLLPKAPSYPMILEQPASPSPRVQELRQILLDLPHLPAPDAMKMWTNGHIVEEVAKTGDLGLCQHLERVYWGKRDNGVPRSMLSASDFYHYFVIGLEQAPKIDHVLSDFTQPRSHPWFKILDALVDCMYSPVLCPRVFGWCFDHQVKTARALRPVEEEWVRHYNTYVAPFDHQLKRHQLQNAMDLIYKIFHRVPLVDEDIYKHLDEFWAQSDMLRDALIVFDKSQKYENVQQGGFPRLQAYTDKRALLEVVVWPSSSFSKKM